VLQTLLIRMKLIKVKSLQMAVVVVIVCSWIYNYLCNNCL